MHVSNILNFDECFKVRYFFRKSKMSWLNPIKLKGKCLTLNVNILNGNINARMVQIEVKNSYWNFKNERVRQREIDKTYELGIGRQKERNESRRKVERQRCTECITFRERKGEMHKDREKHINQGWQKATQRERKINRDS